MASELSKLIEDELEKVEGANRKDEHQKRLSSLRIKTPSPERSPTGPHSALRFWTKKRVAIGLLAGLALVAVAFLMLTRRDAALSGTGSSGGLSDFDTESAASTVQAPPSHQVNSTAGLDHHHSLNLTKASHPEKQGQHVKSPPSIRPTHHAHHHAPDSAPVNIATESADIALAAPADLPSAAPAMTTASQHTEAIAPMPSDHTLAAPSQEAIAPEEIVPPGLASPAASLVLGENAPAPAPTLEIVTEAAIEG